MPTHGLNAIMATDPYPPRPYSRGRNPAGRWRHRWLHRLRLLPVRLIELSPFGAALAASPLMYNEFTIFPRVMLAMCVLAIPFYLLFSWQRRATLRDRKSVVEGKSVAAGRRGSPERQTRRGRSS